VIFDDIFVPDMTRQTRHASQHNQLSITGFSDLHLYEAANEAEDNVFAKFTKSVGRITEHAVKIM
jgi:hypothetical protein